VAYGASKPTVSGQTVLVHGVRGSVSSLAAQLARWGGATVIGTVRGEAEARQVSPGAADHVVSLHSGPIPAIRQVTPAGVDRIIEVALSAKADLDAAIVRNGAVLAAYASPKDRPELPFWPMLFANVTIRLLGSDDFPLRAKDAVARDLTHAAAQSALSITIAEIVPLAQIAAQIPAAQELIESGRPQAGCSCRFPSAGRGRATRARGRPRSGYRPTPGLPPGQVLQPGTLGSNVVPARLTSGSSGHLPLRPSASAVSR
jgi:NADPH:quinone reductase-like Zn-dependent oxidoreductase